MVFEQYHVPDISTSGLNWPSITGCWGHWKMLERENPESNSSWSEFRVCIMMVRFSVTFTTQVRRRRLNITRTESKSTISVVPWDVKLVGLMNSKGVCFGYECEARAWAWARLRETALRNGVLGYGGTENEPTIASTALFS